MAYSDLLNKIESAFATVVTSAGVTGLNVYTHQDDETQALPKAIVRAERFQERFETGLYGNFQGVVGVRIVTNADDTTESAHRDIVATVFDKLSMDDLAATVSAAETDFTLIGVLAMAQEHGQEDRSHFSEWGAEILCCPSDV